MPNIFLLRNQVVQFSRSVVSDSALIAQLVKKSEGKEKKLDCLDNMRKGAHVYCLIGEKKQLENSE